MIIAVLSPHQDDAAFSIGLTIDIWLNLGHQVEVINCFTKSDYCAFGALSVSPSDLQQSVTELRHQEDVRWSRLYKRQVKLTDLDLTDAPQRLQCSVAEVCSTSVQCSDTALAIIRAEVEARRMDALVLPLAIGGHVDHLTARRAAQEGSRQSLPLAFYEDLPYSARPGAASSIPACVIGVASGLVPTFASDKAEVKAAIQRKRELALCYSSQIDEATADQIAYFCERYGGRERLWGDQVWRVAGPGGYGVT
jgi:LmbE family N-acetylglucosaminyl deacetylase